MSLIFAKAELSGRFLSIDAIRFSAFKVCDRFSEGRIRSLVLTTVFLLSNSFLFFNASVLAKGRGDILAPLTHHILLLGKIEEKGEMLKLNINFINFRNMKVCVVIMLLT